MIEQTQWIGVDLDGTVAKYVKWKSLYTIGDPIPKMVARIKKWRAKGIEVRIMTARACLRDPKMTEVIQDWTEKHIGERLPVTNEKDFGMIRLYDDRARQVEENTGMIYDEYEADQL